MKVLSGIIIFIIVLFFYLHLQYQLKTSNDLEIYTIDYPSKDRLEEICDIRQPMTFQYNINDEVLNRQYIVDNYSAFDVQIRDSKDTDNYSIPLAISVANKAFYSDKAQQYYSENNQNFLEETGLIKRLQNHDTLLRPLMVSNCYYDLGFDEKSLEFLHNCISINPNNEQALRSLSSYYYDKDLNLSLEYAKKGARLGNEHLQKWLKERGDEY